MGSGYDPFELPGESSEEVVAYEVRCPVPGCDQYFLSLKWERGDRCPVHGTKMIVTEAEGARRRFRARAKTKAKSPEVREEIEDLTVSKEETPEE